MTQTDRSTKEGIHLRGSLSQAGEVEQIQRARVSIALASIAASLPLMVFNLAFVERKWKILLNRGPFLLEYPLQAWQKILFLLFFAAAITLLIATLSLILWSLVRRLLSLLGIEAWWLAKFTVLAVALAYFAAITTQYKVVEYFRDGVNLALLRRLGGGEFTTALKYAQDEFAGLLPSVAASFVILFAGGWLLRKHGRRLSPWLSRRWPVRLLSSPPGLLAANAALVICTWLLWMTSFSLHQDLRFVVAYQLYSFPTVTLTRLYADRMDPARYALDSAAAGMSPTPRALSIAGRGIHEGAAADGPPETVWQQRDTAWQGSQLQRKNVLLLVLESARYDLLDARVDGEPVMPVLSSLPGERLLMYSHAGYTGPSLCAIFNGVMDERETGTSLVDRFRELGYHTGVFSGQSEAFDDIRSRTHMDHADVYVDAGSFSSEQRMYANTAASALSVPAPLVAARFRQWLRGIDRRHPFFAYLNWQETHFPYHYWGAPTPLANPPISRGQIVFERQNWLKRTYWNAARNLDSALAGVLAELDQLGLRSQTVILVVGDHGEELFEHGYLGHGLSISFEQYATTGKLINSNWIPPRRPIGLDSVSALIHNALVLRPEYALPLDEHFFCYTGVITEPTQLGLVTSDGIVKFDFQRRRWTRQAAPGQEFVSSPSLPALIQLWQLYLGQMPPPDRRTQ